MSEPLPAAAPSAAESPITVGRYLLHRQIARGGMATIHIARLMGDEGFSRIVAAKRLLPEFAEDAEFVAMFLDEARIASKVHHRNVVPVLDVVTAEGQVVLVQEYVHGAPLHWLLARARQAGARVPGEIAVAIACGVLAGLHAAHEMVDELGVPLDVVHRDVSPQNVMIATDGTARLLDFGIAKASMAAHVTRAGTYKGKLAYSAPEQVRGQATRQSDLYSLAVLLWELLVGARMHAAQSDASLVQTIMSGALPTITGALAAERERAGGIGDAEWMRLVALEAIVQRGLATHAEWRWRTAADMEEALVAAVQPASPSAVAAWLRQFGQDYLDKHDRVIAAEEASWRRVAPVLRNRGATASYLTSLTSLAIGTTATAAAAGEPGVARGGESVLSRVAGVGTPSWVTSSDVRPRVPAALFAVFGGLAVALVIAVALLVRSEPPAQPALGVPTDPPRPPRPPRSRHPPRRSRHPPRRRRHPRPPWKPRRRHQADDTAADPRLPRADHGPRRARPAPAPRASRDPRPRAPPPSPRHLLRRARSSGPPPRRRPPSRRPPRAAPRPTTSRAPRRSSNPRVCERSPR